jgi:hypothetical protein
MAGEPVPVTEMPNPLLPLPVRVRLWASWTVRVPPVRLRPPRMASEPDAPRSSVGELAVAAMMVLGRLMAPLGTIPLNHLLVR